MAVYVRPRVTIDIMIKPDILEKVKQIVENFRYSVPAMPVSFKDGAVKIHRLRKIDEESGYNEHFKGASKKYFRKK